MFIKRKLSISRLLDTKNSDLYIFVKNALNLSIEPTTEPNYGVYCKGNNATIFVPNGKLSPSSFAHELLHAELKARGIFFSTKLSVSGRPALIPIFSDSLSDHITNVLEHRKMFQRFIELGYKEVDFLSDSLSRVLTLAECETLIKRIKRDCYYSSASIDAFIGKYLAARCSCFSFFDYAPELQLLREAEPELSSILDQLVDRWDDYDIEKEGDLQSDSCFMISDDFLDEVEDWIKTIQVL